MLDQLIIQNFQSHKKAIINFHKNINVFIGTSDSGKSSIIRALNWVVNNKPSGDAFRRNGTKETQVDLFTDNKKIFRKKTKSKNTYSIIIGNDNSNASIEFKAFGQGVPQEIQDILQISNINIQQQHDSPFMLSKSSGEVARYLNKIVDLDIIDIALTNAKRKENKIRSTIEFEENQLKEYQESIKKYDWIDEAEKQTELLIKIETGINEKKSKLSLINSLIDNILIAETYKKKYKKKTKYKKQVNELIKLNDKTKELNNTKNLIFEITDNITRSNEKIISYKNDVKYEKQINNLIKLDNEIEEILSTKNSIVIILKKISRYNEKIIQNKSDIKYEKKVNALIILDKEINIIHNKKIDFSKCTASIDLSSLRIKRFQKQLKEKQNKFKKLFPKECSKKCPLFQN